MKGRTIMNVFILDKDIGCSARMLDDSHLRAQINEACQILMAGYNKMYYPEAKIGHANHPVTRFYFERNRATELFSYLDELLSEYCFRFGKQHQNVFWWMGFRHRVGELPKEFRYSKTYVDGAMTDDIDEIRKCISTKPMQKKPTWTRRERPDWWEV